LRVVKLACKTSARKNDPECVFFCPGGSLEVAGPGDILQIKVDPLEAVHDTLTNIRYFSMKQKCLKCLKYNTPLLFYSGVVLSNAAFHDTDVLYKLVSLALGPYPVDQQKKS
jgi:hypothetical protein